MIKEKDVIEYWRCRVEKYGERAIGFNNQDMKAQDEHHKVREEFIFKNCPTDLLTLDYGCGIGRYVHRFNDYCGIDITERLIDIAKVNHPDKRFVQIKQSYLILDLDIDNDFELFFTANVLQHNSDEVVLKIVESVIPYMKDKCIFSIYENSYIDGDTCKKRTSDEYIILMEQNFVVKSFNSWSHVIHGAEHTHTLVKVKKH